ncbi:UPF0764 protein C16orf89 homolog [Aplysia californica]|uniref:UPF0764 protein C16orf89 homolog n=1 Tax=Aplysia californica TaxID=6500 RepID=A0ABM0JJ04_APLCA|nr:UPF0764 protein C16orf89 homolog [Aplysia californica]
MALLPTLVVGLLTTTLTFTLPSHAMALTPNSTLDYLDRTLTGLELAMNFFQREHRHVNLDALIGTRMVQASFTVLLRRLERSGLISHVPSYILDSIRRLRETARDVSEVATPYVISAEPDYYKSKYFSGVPCSISKQCWKRMTSLGYSRYSLSHQIFYLEVAERTGCKEEMQWHLKDQHQGSISLLHGVFCANMVSESELFAESGFPEKSQDLFMEQAALCGMLGYRDFFNSDWLNKVLSWQDREDGCYRWAAWPLKEHTEKRSRGHHHLEKREEKRVGRGCLCHRTTVASAALAQYTRYVLEVWLEEQGL